MDKPVARRTSDPAIIKKFYQAIECIRKQRQIANLTRIVKYMEREYSYPPKEILQLLHKAVIDGLVIETITIGCKGSKAGVEQEGYWIPDVDQVLIDRESETHDWYCFVCHRPGDVITCATCVSVYHSDCIVSSLSEKNSHGKWTCPSCTSISKEAETEDKVELARCLSFVVTQQKDNIPELKKRLSELAPSQVFFIFTYYDLNTLHRDCQKGVFSSVEEFRQKIRLIQHNICIMFGAKHKLAKSVEDLVKACLYELEELKLCKNCFYLSNSKPMDDWFCQPCNPPHQVVWAKQKGFDFWPAKVIQVEDDRLDVRFFGKHHPRAWITIDAIRGISVSPVELKIKRKQHWKQASNEMKEYIRQCECALGKEEASKIIFCDSPFGIGKNPKLVSAMMSMGKQPAQECTLSSLNFDLNISKLTPKKNSQEDSTVEGRETKPSSLELKETVLDSAIATDSTGDFIDFITGLNGNNRVSGKRHAEEVCSDTPETKKTKYKESAHVEDDAHAEIAINCDKQTQVSPSELGGSACSCKLRYGTILEKFKDYVIESSRLQNGKLIRAAACKAAFDQKQAEKQAKENVTLEFEKIISGLKDAHQREINQLKTKYWCCICQEEATISCSRSTHYCSIECKDKDFGEHKSVCAVISDVDDGKLITNLSTPRPRRVIKPKVEN